MTNGRILDKQIEGIPCSIVIPGINEYTRPALPMKPQSITIHETGNRAKGAGAASHSVYLSNLSRTGGTYKSWHFVVDDKEIIQCLPINEISWHAGDGYNGPGNRTSISIEICVNIDGNFEMAKRNAAALCRYLMSELHIERIVPHMFWSGKNCPETILKTGGIESFIALVNQPAAPPAPVDVLDRLIDKGIAAQTIDNIYKAIDEFMLEIVKRLDGE